MMMEARSFVFRNILILVCKGDRYLYTIITLLCHIRVFDPMHNYMFFHIFSTMMCTCLCLDNILPGK